MFSHKRVRELEYIVQDKALKVCKRMQEAIARMMPVDLYHAFRAVSIDLISEFAFNKSYDFLDKDELGAYSFRISAVSGPRCGYSSNYPASKLLHLRSHHGSCHICRSL